MNEKRLPPRLMVLLVVLKGEKVYKIPLEKWESDKRETPLFDSLAASELIRQLNK